jgi:hypothetical protein
VATAADTIPGPRWIVEAMSLLRHPRASAVKARTQAALVLRNLIVTASTGRGGQ